MSTPASPVVWHRLRLARDVHAPVTLLDRRAAAPNAGSRYLGSVREIRVDGGRVHVVLGIAGRPFVYEAGWEEEIGLLHWQGPDSAGSIRFTPLGFERSRVVLELSWRPQSLLGRLAAALGFDRRRAAAELHRLVLVVESEAGDARLNALVRPVARDGEE